MGLKELFKGNMAQAYVFLAVFTILKIAFFKEGTFDLIKLLVVLYWLFYLPGYAITYFWKDKIDPAERIIISFVAGFAAVGIMVYHLGIIGINNKLSSFLAPLTVFCICLAAYYVRSKIKKQIVSSEMPSPESDN